MISKSERTELRSVVRQQFKVLRAEVAQREAELKTDAFRQVAEKFEEDDKQWADTEFLAKQAVSEANRKINDHLRENGYEVPEGADYNVVSLAWTFSHIQKKTPRGDMEKSAALEISERVHRARLQLERQEADLLRSLAVDALESDEAKAFLSHIPTVSELVPAVRMAEIEAAYEAMDK